MGYCLLTRLSLDAITLLNVHHSPCELTRNLELGGAHNAEQSLLETVAPGLVA
jgi:hypothetical protein